jgi:predicted small secreted protein
MKNVDDALLVVVAAQSVGCNTVEGMGMDKNSIENAQEDK